MLLKICEKCGDTFEDRGGDDLRDENLCDLCCEEDEGYRPLNFNKD